jgi:pimeloyl-ACP methyl ester carboxylesterase
VQTSKFGILRKKYSQIQCPVLAIQGFEDPYGTMAQIEGIKEVVNQTVLIKIPDCGHSPIGNNL